MSEPKTMQSNAKQCFDIAEPKPMLRRRSRRNIVQGAKFI